MLEETNIRGVSFISKSTKVTLSLEYIKYLKSKNTEVIDLSVYKQILDDLNKVKFDFILTSQEQNYIRFLDEGKILKYILYRYVFREYPKKKINTKFPTYILIEPVSSCNLKFALLFFINSKASIISFAPKVDILKLSSSWLISSLIAIFD